MTSIIRYSGIVALSLSLVMLSLGSIPQSYAGVNIPSTMTIITTCSILPSGELDWFEVNLGDLLDSSAPPAGATITAAVANNGNGRSVISMGVGDDTAGGGYANGGITHIAAADIQLGLGDIGTTPFVVAMVSNAFVPVGFVDSTTSDPLDAIVLVNGINLPSITPEWVMTITITQVDCLILD